MGTAGHAVGSAVRSTSFLAAFVGIYSAAISLHRKLFTWDHKLLYYVAGNQLPCAKQVRLQRSDCIIQYIGLKLALAQQITPCLMCSKTFECTHMLAQQLVPTQQAYGHKSFSTTIVTNLLV